MSVCTYIFACINVKSNYFENYLFLWEIKIRLFFKIQIWHIFNCSSAALIALIEILACTRKFIVLHYFAINYGSVPADVAALPTA